jgi:hypothetical protein
MIPTSIEPSISTEESDRWHTLLRPYLKRATNRMIVLKYIDRVSAHQPGLKEALIYELIDRIQTEPPTRDRLSTWIRWIHDHQLLFSSLPYQPLKEQQEEEDTFQTTPFEVEEGVLECFKCHSKRTLSYQRQTRNADEGSTTFAQCAECGHRWRHNN